jgi:uncharacterized protein YkwD
VIALALLLSALPSAAGATGCDEAAQAAPRVASDHQLRTAVLCLVNRIRERHRIPALEFSPALRRSATLHSKSMVSSGSLSHYGPRGSTPATRVIRSGYLSNTSVLRVAENIAAGMGRSFGSPIAVVRGWMRSPSHRQNVLDAGLRDFGAGIARGDPFGRRSNAATYTLDLAARHP